MSLCIQSYCIHSLVIERDSFDEPIYIEEYAPFHFSPLLQAGAINPEFTKDMMICRNQLEPGGYN